MFISLFPALTTREGELLQAGLSTMQLRAFLCTSPYMTWKALGEQIKVCRGLFKDYHKTDI